MNIGDIFSKEDLVKYLEEAVKLGVFRIYTTCQQCGTIIYSMEDMGYFYYRSEPACIDCSNTILVKSALPLTKLINKKP